MNCLKRSEGIILLLFCFSCNQQPQSPIVNGSTDRVLESVDSLMKLMQYEDAVTILDSIASVEDDTGVHPDIYFQRGMCATYLLRHEDAIKDFKKSLELKHEEKICIEMIRFNQSALNGY